MADKQLGIVLRAIGASAAAKAVGQVDSAIGKLGAKAKSLSGLKIGLAAVGAAATAGIAAGIRGGLDSLADLEDAVYSVQGAIDQLGLAGQLTGSQVADWANQIESDVQAAFDDKEIVAATEGLIRYGKVTADNLRPAMVVMTDLAAKTGDVGSASDLLAKAMADPAKAAGKLARVGVILTDEQEAQIKAFDKVGDAASAQRVLLDALAKSTKGAAAASKGPYRDALNLLADTAEDAKRALATGFLPVIQRVATTLRTKMADPKVMDAIQSIGNGLAMGFDRAVTLAERIPWGVVADAFGILGTGAKAALDLFTSMPPWVQTAVVTGWGLNKITGGALGDIVGELGKGLIKGILGINAGVVNVNAATVNGPGTPGVASAGKSGAAAGGAMVPAIGAVAAIDMNFLDEMARRDLGHTLGESVDEALGSKVTDLKYALVSAQQQTENLLRANLYRPQPAPVVNLTVSTSVSVSSMWNATMQSYYAGIRDKIR